MIHRCPTCGRDNRIPASRLTARARCGACKTELLPLTKPYEVKDESTFSEIVSSSSLPVIVDFWAPWCGPCRAIAPELTKIAALYAGRALIVKVNSDELPELSSRYRVRGIPTLLRFDRGRETKRVTGAMPASALVSELGLPHDPANVDHFAQ